MYYNVFKLLRNKKGKSVTFKIVVDLEATCTDRDEFPRDEMETIEIGAVCLDENGEQRDSFQAFIKPVKHPVLTDFCKQLTTIKQSDVDGAESFEEAFERFLSWVGNIVGRNDYTFMSWGDFDRNILRRQCAEFDIDAAQFLSTHKNAKAMFADYYGIKPCGVGKALKLLKMEFEGTPHRAKDDAVNIGKLINSMD